MLALCGDSWIPGMPWMLGLEIPGIPTLVSNKKQQQQKRSGASASLRRCQGNHAPATAHLISIGILSGNNARTGLRTCVSPFPESRNVLF